MKTNIGSDSSNDIFIKLYQWFELLTKPGMGRRIVEKVMNKQSWSQIDLNLYEVSFSKSKRD